MNPRIAAKGMLHGPADTGLLVLLDFILTDLPELLRAVDTTAIPSRRMD